eukprot:9574832-Lingulodinium_polyedra.AAC.1
MPLDRGIGKAQPARPPKKLKSEEEKAERGVQRDQEKSLKELMVLVAKLSLSNEYQARVVRAVSSME